jgi:hypothetical protein
VVDERKQSFILVSEGKAVAGTWQWFWQKTEGLITNTKSLKLGTRG